MAATDSPLNEEHLEKLNKALEACTRARNQIALARAAGIDISQQERVLEEAESKVRQIKQAYFPGR